MASYVNAYLSKCLQRLTSRSQGLTVVLGNEAGDMDSIVGSIFLAMHLDSAEEYKISPVIPVMNFPLHELPLRVDVHHLLQEVGVDMSLLISVALDTTPRKDDNYLDLASTLPNVILYDHNKLSVSQNFLSSNVVGVVDHHFDDNLYVQQSKKLRIIETTGSACTLVAEMYKEAGAVVPSPILLLSAIILDTVNFDLQQKKTTPKDLEMFNWLTSMVSEEVDSHQIFEKLSAWRNDIFSLTLEQNFIRDYKVFSFEYGKGGCLSIGFSSIPCSYEMFKDKYPSKEIALSCHSLLSAKKLDAFIICLAGKKNGIHTRDIAFVVRTDDLPVFLDYTVSFRTNVVFRPIDKYAIGDSHVLVVFSLNDNSVSRKKLVPSLSDFFKGKTQSPL